MPVLRSMLLNATLQKRCQVIRNRKDNRPKHEGLLVDFLLGRQVLKISFGGIPDSRSAYIAVSCALPFSISNLHVGALFCSWASKTLQNLRLALGSPEPSGTFRNLPKPSGTFAPEPAPAHTGTLRNPPKPSGTCACDPHRRTQELIWAEEPTS